MKRCVLLFLFLDVSAKTKDFRTEVAHAFMVSFFSARSEIHIHTFTNISAMHTHEENTNLIQNVTHKHTYTDTRTKAGICVCERPDNCKFEQETTIESE